MFLSCFCGFKPFKSYFGAGILVQQVKPQIMTLTSCTGVLVCVPAAQIPSRLRINALGKAEDDGSNIWALATHVGDQIEFWAPGFGLDLTWLLWPFGE